MFRKGTIIPAMALMAFAPFVSAHAAVRSEGQPAERIPRAAGIRLAQVGEAEVYYDREGRRVLVDRETGEVLSIERRISRQEWRRIQRQRALQREGRFYDDDPSYGDVPPALERPRLRERRYELDEDGLPRDYSRYPDDNVPEVDPDAFPEAPGDEIVKPASRPETAGRDTVERRQLDERPVGSTPPRAETASAEPADGASARASLDGGTATQPADTALPSDKTAEPTITGNSRPEVAALQILLDRKGASPGVIDGRFGSNVDKALAAYREITGDNLKSTDTEGIKKRLAESGGEPFASYQITAEDAAGPYVASIPEDYGKKAQLERMSFTSVTEALAERFHMDEAYLKALNPGLDFNRPGTIVKVANFGRLASAPVARIVADKGRKQVRAYDEAGKLVAAYPATIGSADTPSPSGTHAVSRVALDPNYTYNPNLNFKQGDNTKVLTIPPGPNGPVGSVWIALDKPTYGIHGTPEPSKIGKSESHGCVRLTNWDARELAKLVRPGVPVEFVD
ncbi:MAG: murein L,D-transpeptidase [Rhizobiales bacterium]|nr:murein L,D-transpeptidase [Hyphomicrobiales bacterium]